MIISLYAYYKSLKGNWMGWSRIQTKYTQIQMCCVPDVLKSERKKYQSSSFFEYQFDNKNQRRPENNPIPDTE